MFATKSPFNGLLEIISNRGMGVPPMSQGQDAGSTP
jgi:hypothetical protein